MTTLTHFLSTTSGRRSSAPWLRKGTCFLPHPQNFLSCCFCKNTLPCKLLLLFIINHFSCLNLDITASKKIFLVSQIWARCPARPPAATACPPSKLLPHFIVCNCLLLVCLLQSSMNPWGAGTISVLFIQVSIDPNINNLVNVMKVILNFIDTMYGSSISSNLN